MTKMEFAQQLMLIRFMAGANGNFESEAQYIADLTDQLWREADQRSWSSGNGGWHVDRASYVMEKKVA